MIVDMESEGLNRISIIQSLRKLPMAWNHLIGKGRSKIKDYAAFFTLTFPCGVAYESEEAQLMRRSFAMTMGTLAPEVSVEGINFNGKCGRDSRGQASRRWP